MAYSHRLDSGLLPLCDIAETARHYQGIIDWKTAERRAVQWRAKKCAYLSLRLAKDLLAAELPDEVLGALEPDDLEPRFLAWARGAGRARSEQHLAACDQFGAAAREAAAHRENPSIPPNGFPVKRVHGDLVLRSQVL